MTKWASGEPAATQRLPDSGSMNIVKILKDQSESDTMEKAKITTFSNSSTAMPPLDNRQKIIQSMENIFQKKFHKINEIQRRDPSYYMKNPTKTYCLSHGSKDYAFKDMARGTEITGLSKRPSPDNQYNHMVP